MTKKQLPVGKLLVGTLFVLLLSAIAFFAYKVNQVQMPPSPNSPLIGTWTTDFGRVVTFRPDGTARYRGSSNGKPNQIMYFEWMVDSSNTLERCNWSESQRLAWRQRLHSWISGDESSEPPMELVEVGDAGFTLRNTEGIEFKYTPAEDEQIESAP